MALSFSQLSTYRTCPKQYEFAYVKKIPKQISKGESFGSSVHNTLKKWGELEIKLGRRELGVGKNQLELFVEEKSPTPHTLTSDTLLNLWHQSFIVEGFETRMEADLARKRGEDVMHKYFQWWSQKAHHILAVEKGFSLTIDGFNVSGRFDRVEKTDSGICVIDYKTSKPRSQDTVDADLQLSIYALAIQEVYGEKCSELTLLFLREDEEILEVRTERNENQLKDALKQLKLIESQIASRDFHPTPAIEKCSRCPYRSICPAAAVK